MTPFRFSLRPGAPIADQVELAAIRAFVSDEFAPGAAFPSVRSLAAALKVHPNTAHKVVQRLIQAGWLTSRPGVGTVVARPAGALGQERRRLLQREIDDLVDGAQRIGLTLPDLLEAIRARWVGGTTAGGDGG